MFLVKTFFFLLYKTPKCNLVGRLCVLVLTQIQRIAQWVEADQIYLELFGWDRLLDVYTALWDWFLFPSP